jgi:hypothetical protein
MIKRRREETQKMIRTTGLAHIYLVVRDIERSLRPGGYVVELGNPTG